MTDEIRVAWAAGLFEGEGCVALTGSPYRSRVRFTLSSTDEDVVRKFHEIVGCGNVNGPFLPRDGVKQQWRWDASKKDAVDHLVGILRPHLGERRGARLDECLGIVEAQGPPVHYNTLKTHCRNGHPYEGSNLILGQGYRRCRSCEQLRWTRKNAVKRGESLTDLEVAQKVAGL